MALPRKVSGLVLPSGGRLELLVRCSAAAGQTRVLNAGAAAAGVFSNSSFGNIFWPTGNPYLIQQEVLATIQMQVGATGLLGCCLAKHPKGHEQHQCRAAMASAACRLGPEGPVLL